MELIQNRLEALFASDAALSWTMPEFLECYTLHDANLLEVRLAFSPSAALFLTIQLDLVWNTAIPEPFQLLVVRFPRVYRADWTEGPFQCSILAEAESRPLSDDERTRLLEDGRSDLAQYKREDAPTFGVPHPAMDETATRTVLQGIGGWSLELLHSSELQFASLDAEGRSFSIPTQRPRNDA